MHIPAPILKPVPKVNDKDSEDSLEWEEDAAALLEWVGLACLGSQRYAQSLT